MPVRNERKEENAFLVRYSLFNIHGVPEQQKVTE